MMNFEDFTMQLMKDVYAALEEDFPGIDIEIRRINKTQGESYTAMSLTPVGEKVGVSVNLEQAYGYVQAGNSYDFTILRILEQAKKNLKDRADFNIQEIISSYENIKPRLYIEVVGTKSNAEILTRVPHTDIADLSLIYRVMLDDRGDTISTMLVNNDILARIGVTKEQLHADALANSVRIRPVTITNMREAMAELTGIPVSAFPEGPAPLYIVSNKTQSHGASALFYPGFLDHAVEMLGGSFFVFPSSIHEVIITPDNEVLEIDKMQELVSDTNANEVVPEDRLSDSVYHYDAKNHIFELAESWEDRKRN